VELEENPTTTPGTGALDGGETGVRVLAATGIEDNVTDGDLREVGFGSCHDSRSAFGRPIHDYMPIPILPLPPLQSSVAEGQHAMTLLLAFIVTVAERFISWPPLAPSVPVQYPQAKPGRAAASRLTTAPLLKLSEGL
jgi:hypothetical protein